MARTKKNRTVKTLDANHGVLHGAVCVATVSKAFGTSGEILVKFTPDAPDSLFDMLEEGCKLPMFINFENLPVPFYIEKLNFRGSNGAILKFTTVNDLSYAEELTGAKIYMELAEGSESEGLVGFTALNKDGGEIGIVSGFLDIPMNPCLEISRKGAGSFVTPVNEELLLDIDEDKRTITIIVPVGLEDLNS